MGLHGASTLLRNSCSLEEPEAQEGEVDDDGHRRTI